MQEPWLADLQDPQRRQQQHAVRPAARPPLRPNLQYPHLARCATNSSRRLCSASQDPQLSQLRANYPAISDGDLGSQVDAVQQGVILPACLTARQRAALHQWAEDSSLAHASIGEGEARRLCLGPAKVHEQVGNGINLAGSLKILCIDVKIRCQNRHIGREGDLRG